MFISSHTYIDPYVCIYLHMRMYIILFIHSFESSWYHDNRTLEAINMSLKGIIFLLYSKKF